MVGESVQYMEVAAVAVVYFKHWINTLVFQE